MMRPAGQKQSAHPSVDEFAPQRSGNFLATVVRFIFEDDRQLPLSWRAHTANPTTAELEPQLTERTRPPREHGALGRSFGRWVSALVQFVRSIPGFIPFSLWKPVRLKLWLESCRSQRVFISAA